MIKLHFGINDSNEFVSRGRFAQFTNKQGLGCPLYKQTLKLHHWRLP